VGIELYVQYHGYFTNDLAFHIGIHKPATVSDPHPQQEMCTAPSFTYVIRHPSAGWIFFDTGNHRENSNGRIPEEVEIFPWTVAPEQHYLASLEALGLAPKDAGLLVLSHLHNDHAGNLDLFAGTQAGRAVVVQRRELEHALFVTHKTNSTYVDSYNRADFAGIDGIEFLTIDGDTDVAPGVRLIHLPGHSPGSQALVVQLEQTGTVILTADAVYQWRNYGPPAVPPGILDSKREWLESVDKLRLMELALGAKLLFGHDADQLSSLTLAPAAYH